MEEAATKVVATPTKTTTLMQHKLQNSENQNPNLPLKSSKSPKPKAAPAIVVRSPQNRIRHRKFLVAKRNNNSKTVSSCKCREEKGDDGAKCLCVAYENLRASQEEFLKNRQQELKKDCEDEEEELIEASLKIQDLRIHDNEEEVEKNEIDELELEGSSNVKRRRDKLLEEARNSVPETGSGKVMHLVKAFEKILSMPKSRKKDQNEEEEKFEEENEKREHNDENGHGEGNNGHTNSCKVKSKVMKWALPGLQFEQPSFKAPELEVTGSCSGSGSSLICASDLVLTSENLGLDSRISVSSSWDSSHGSVSSRTSATGGRRSRRNSLDSSGAYGGRRWKKKQPPKVTNQKPFKLRTEQRGELKKEEFMKKVQEIMTEEQKMRIPIAQGLPWTTDEAECLVKPPVKESTKPIDLKLHSDVRAVDRAEFDQQVAEKMSLIEQLKLERERQQKLEEEEEIRRLRKELIPKAQPMPYFDRPFIPRRSTKHPTIPREPKFHIPQHKKIKCLSWNDLKIY
ncbi:hypothetical protein HN51_032867 [Arachis hypogaea]|uniref:TPX2 C-terminal domain-containing protein n=1 Tax=Arachis hypogaea TaxID=3818 RepID=A0A445B2V4_ARAHY|nr:uncharacterized protein LOC112716474 [Arachis hypogaea]QHO17259.1 hypothetical protein DS421_10g310620 [Arachis hypogaea]RYR33013.1 hypothetical protein Ahy_A10g047549 [Arachis hypogaea]